MFPAGILSIVDSINCSLKWKSAFFLLETIKTTGADFSLYTSFAKNQTNVQKAKILQISQQWVPFDHKRWRWLFNEIVFFFRRIYRHHCVFGKK